MHLLFKELYFIMSAFVVLYFINIAALEIWKIKYVRMNNMFSSLFNFKRNNS